jgi:hypothetical protein
MRKIILLILLITFVSKAQWQTDIRLTNDPAGSLTSYNNAWCIASNGNIMHIIWYDDRDGNSEIYYKRSTNGGVSWGADIRLTINSSASYYPSEALSGSAVHCIWQDNRDGNTEIYYKRSTNGGVSWETDTRLTNDNSNSNYPSVSVTGTTVHVVWQDNRDGNAEIYYKRSTDGGVNWEADTRLTNANGNSWYPCCAVSGQAVNIVWQEERDGNREIYFKRSTDGGISWNADTRMTNDPSNSWNPSIGISGQAVHIVWSDERDGNGSEVYYKRSTDGGTTWGTDTRLTNAPYGSNYSSVSVSGQVVHIVWEDGRDFNVDIYYKRSTDGGVSWGADTRLTYDPSLSYYPSVAVSGSVVHAVWQDNRNGNWEVYYKKDTTGNLTGINNLNSEIPNRFSLSQNYPNPFNPTTKIHFSFPPSPLERVGVRLVIYDVLGRKVETLINEQLQTGTYEVEFDGSRYSSGLYFYTIQSESFKETRKMVLLK